MNLAAPVSTPLRSALRVLLLAGALVASAFDPFVDESGIYLVNWERGEIPMELNLPNAPTLSDGSTQRSSVEVAMQAWNAQLGNVQFTWSYGTEGRYSLGNNTSEIAMDDSIGNMSFGPSTLAVALSYTDGNYHVESDVIFNDRWTWDSYRGALRSQDDIRRVAIHELGHVLGLGHPNQAEPPQSVTAIMNSVVSDLDTLAADDIAGGHFHYGPPNSPPPNDGFADAIELVLGPDGTATATGTSVQSTAEPGEPVLDPDYPGGRSVWWKWTAPASGSVELTALGSRYDTFLGVFTGDTVDALGLVGKNDDVDPGVVRTSTLTFDAVAGTTYHFMLDGWDGYEGPAQINLRAELSVRHSADTDRDWRLNLDELLRVIELYNTRHGTSRTGRYREDETVDGFAPDDRALSIEESNTRFHSADSDRDGLLSLGELLRVIELYNTREGTTRTGAYRIDPDSVDGFGPDGAE